MAKQVQMAKVYCHGEIRVIKYDTADHPYKVIKTWHENGNKKTKQLHAAKSYEGAIRFVWRYVEDNYTE